MRRLGENIATPFAPAPVQQGQRLSARTVNLLLEIARRLGGIVEGRQEYRPGIPYDQQSFGFSWLAPNKVRIYTGDFHRDGDDYDEVAEDDVTLTGNDCYVYVSKARDGTGPVSIATDGAKPKTDGTNYKICLYHFELTTGTTYRLVRDHRWDIHFDLPL